MYFVRRFKDESGWTPLHLAAASGHVDIIKWLTSAGRDDLDAETPTGYTPTHVAAMNGHMDAVMVSAFIYLLSYPPFRCNGLLGVWC